MTLRQGVQWSEQRDPTQCAASAQSQLYKPVREMVWILLQERSPPLSPDIVKQVQGSVTDRVRTGE
jgi:tRNA U38,U39,U40 pseudouridine synthase TruA